MAWWFSIAIQAKFDLELGNLPCATLWLSGWKSIPGLFEFTIPFVYGDFFCGGDTTLTASVIIDLKYNRGKMPFYTLITGEASFTGKRVFIKNHELGIL